VYGYNVRTNTSSVSDLVSSYNKTLETKGDMLMNTNVEAFNACLLDAHALPGLDRLGDCPDDMRLRDGLPTMPRFAEWRYWRERRVQYYVILNASAILGPGSGWSAWHYPLPSARLGSVKNGTLSSIFGVHPCVLCLGLSQGINE
jgi:hypothetical protein